MYLALEICTTQFTNKTNTLPWSVSAADIFCHIYDYRQNRQIHNKPKINGKL